MNQTCKVCGEPAAGFHFGAFTCEGCKSFFGRSYNNLSSISECKNNGECVINKKNRTACKACRLRKCLMVGMSKSGSRYGRRSNWFKIHCLLQEQQQAAQNAAQAAGGGPKSPNHGPPPGMSLPFHPGFQMGHHRPPNNDLMLLGLEEYTKMPNANSTVSSPDSHNSDSSIDITDRTQLMKKFSEHNQHHSPTSSGGQNQKSSTGSGGPNNKDMFLPLPFSALSQMPMMPPPGFLPQSHLLFPGYHPALYSHHQGLLKPVDQHMMNSSLAFHHQQQQQQQQQMQNNNSRFTPNHNHPMFSGALGLGGLNSAAVKHSKAAEELTKRFYLDAVLKSQMSPRTNGLPKSSSPEPALHHHIHRQDEEEAEDEDSLTETREDIDKNNNNNSNSNGSPNHITHNHHHSSTKATTPSAGKDDHAMLNAMTPPRSPINSSHGSGGGQKLNLTPKASAGAGVEMRKRISADVSPASTSSSSSTSTAVHQDNPIDLSMKTSSSTTSDENQRSPSSVAGSDDLEVDEDPISEPSEPIQKKSHPRSTSPMIRIGTTEVGSDSEDEETKYGQTIKRMKFQGTTPLDLTTKV